MDFFPYVDLKNRLAALEERMDEQQGVMLEPVSYVPTVGGLDVSAAASYMKVGRLVHVQFLLSVNPVYGFGTVTLSTPSEIDTGPLSNIDGNSFVALGTAVGIPANSMLTRRAFTIIQNVSETVLFSDDNAEGNNTTVSASRPWEWAEDDQITGRFSYWEAE